MAQEPHPHQPHPLLCLFMEWSPFTIDFCTSKRRVWSMIVAYGKPCKYWMVFQLVDINHDTLTIALILLGAEIHVVLNFDDYMVFFYCPMYLWINSCTIHPVYFSTLCISQFWSPQVVILWHPKALTLWLPRVIFVDKGKLFCPYVRWETIDSRGYFCLQKDLVGTFRLVQNIGTFVGRLCTEKTKTTKNKNYE